MPRGCIGGQARSESSNIATPKSIVVTGFAQGALSKASCENPPSGRERGSETRARSLKVMPPRSLAPELASASSDVSEGRRHRHHSIRRSRILWPRADAVPDVRPTLSSVRPNPLGVWAHVSKPLRRHHGVLEGAGLHMYPRIGPARMYYIELRRLGALGAKKEKNTSSIVVRAVFPALLK